jgi:hypothetical protein
MKILTECGLVVIRQQGRERYCEARLQPLGEVFSWVDQYRDFWTQKFDALENFLIRDERTKDKKSPEGETDPEGIPSGH